MNPTTWSGVRERVLALREAPNAAQVFGARGHRFELLPPLSEVEVAEAEQEFGVGLPADYRSFLLEVGAGGAGPHYGLYPLQRDERGWAWNEGRGVRSDNSLLPQPFPSPAEQARLRAAYDAREPVESAFPDEPAFRVAFRAWDDEWEALSATLTAGAVCLSHEGCGYFDWFVVTGPERGTVWVDLGAADGPLQSLARTPHERLGFREWYLTWLTAATRQAHGR
ncbi:hypothetical protein P3T35_002394 [Kitasatospora sp. GP30]|uniref:SMI1/KNR4 family protein n=1 Tax=Kitasatospora sp. GP30 TaxID=3035084 RepID=UPI000C6FF11D|nr:SMI1/KNR4 family protein [Kitasatospora sp. GP30]MDH6140386.1 hypothetical protein [Kitasatospora sp. GP30]